MLLSMGGISTAEAAATKIKSKASAKTKASAKSKSVKKSTVSTRATTKRKASKAKYSRRAATRGRLARAKAARARALWLEAQTPRYKLDASGSLVPDIRAAAAIVYNPETGEVLWENNSQDTRSIASITKVMTAAVFLEDPPDLSETVVIQRSDTYAANHTYLRPKDRVTLDDLLHLTLIASDNAAARALARAWPDGASAFVDRMNAKAVELGLDHTTYADPSNVSSAYDMARLIAVATADERIAAIMRKAHHTVRTNRRVINIHSTNQLVMKGDMDVRGGKTGFIGKAGYCLATLLRLPQTNQQVAVVVLGAQSNAGRFMETRHLFNWLSTKAPTVFATQQPAPAAPPQ
jgi:D-alanyl-D-alanine endopeptidase (penicillin-binding protein 7)